MTIPRLAFIHYIYLFSIKNAIEILDFLYRLYYVQKRIGLHLLEECFTFQFCWITYKNTSRYNRQPITIAILFFKNLFALSFMNTRETEKLDPRYLCQCSWKNGTKQVYILPHVKCWDSNTLTCPSASNVIKTYQLAPFTS
jgi:hypothetical protein